ncbi:PD-(D/E)XK motif protein [Aeromicrobium sp. UC242_57]|uniref:PD-(D/E)XK motif protein n=1 Tax=Aeromicrobium sp. UC242_57 TaxID=3374624 RepID=UPI0037BCC465
MTTAAELRACIDKVQATAGKGFDVVDVPTAAGFKIGRAEGAAIVLLTPADTSPEPPTQLQRISLEPSSLLHVRHVDGTVEDGQWGLVQLNLGELEYLDTFLSVVANVIDVIGTAPEPGQVSIAMRRLVRLFDPNPVPRGSVLGLWGELLVLCRVSNTNEMLDSWHSDVDDRFDFAAQGSRLEVKTTTLTTRKHIFSLEQVLPVQGATTSVASVMTTETLAGTSLQRMISNAEQLFASDPGRQMRVHEVVAATLGVEWFRHVDRGFDAQQADESIRIFSALDVPKVSTVPPEVSGVTFTADCSEVAPEIAPYGLAALVAV